MMPTLAFVRWRRPGGRPYRLWLPLFLLWLILLPLLLVLLPIVVLILSFAGARPLRTLSALWNLVVALRGTRIDMDSANGAFEIQIF